MIRQMAAIAACVVGLASGVSEAANHWAVLLVDRTGSMTAQRQPPAAPESRCKAAKFQAIERITNYYDFQVPAGEPALVAVYTFDGSSSYPAPELRALTPGFVSRASAIAAVNSLGNETCNGPQTRLADAFCEAAQILGSSTSTDKKYLHIATDGGENASGGTCSGPWGSHLVAGSWQKKVYDLVRANRINTNVNNYIGAGVINLQESEATTEDDRRTVAFQRESAQRLAGSTSPLATCNSTDVCAHYMYLDLCTATGGEYYLIRDNDANFPCAYGFCPPPDSGWFH